MTKYFMVLAFSLPSELCRSFVTTLRSSKLSVGRYSRDCDGLDIHYIVGHCPKQKNENIYTGIFQRKSLMTKHFFALYSDRKKSHRHTDFLICLFGATAQIVTYKRMRAVMWKYCHNHFRLIDWLIDWLIGWLIVRIISDHLDGHSCPSASSSWSLMWQLVYHESVCHAVLILSWSKLSITENEET